MKRLRLAEILVFVMLLPAGAWATSTPAQAPVPYVKPSSLWPFQALQGILMVLGFFAAYRAIRAKLPPGGDVLEKQEKEKQNAARDGAHTSTYESEPIPLMQAASPPKSPKAAAKVIAAVRGAGLLFMVAGSALAFNSGGIDYGPLHIEEDVVRIFGGALFVAGLVDFAVVPRLMAGAERK